MNDEDFHPDPDSVVRMPDGCGWLVVLTLVLLILRLI